MASAVSIRAFFKQSLHSIRYCCLIIRIHEDQIFVNRNSHFLMCFQKTLISASGNIVGLISTQKCQIPKTFHQHNTCQFFSGFLVLVIYKRNFRI